MPQSVDSSWEAAPTQRGEHRRVSRVLSADAHELTIACHESRRSSTLRLATVERDTHSPRVEAVLVAGSDATTVCEPEHRDLERGRARGVCDPLHLENDENDLDTHAADGDVDDQLSAEGA
jgi:hypothetical protein